MGTANVNMCIGDCGKIVSRVQLFSVITRKKDVAGKNISSFTFLKNPVRQVCLNNLQ
jgi:hypothetical protein